MKSSNILSRFPERFIEELKGVADGTGLSLEQVAPNVGTYRLFAGLAAFLQGECRSAVELLESLRLHGVERQLEPLGLYALQQAY